MNWVRVFTITLLACVPAAWADGIPVDHTTRKVTAPNTEVKLNLDQVEEFETLGTVTLTSEQWTALRKVAPETPKRFETVLSVDYNGCTCGLDNYCIALASDRIAVLLGGDLDSALWALPNEASVFLRVDSKGEFSYKGTRVPFETLLDYVGRKPDPEEVKQGAGLRIEIELPIGMKRDDPLVKTQLAQLYEQALKAGRKHNEETTSE
ncbi:MAG: hypothetical protein WC655_02835 [Candidatus Hydrogenedentales bacterium]|jgi:hypothetical protein